MTVFFFFFLAFTGIRVSGVGRRRGQRDVDAQSTELSILRKVIRNRHILL